LAKRAKQADKSIIHDEDNDKSGEKKIDLKEIVEKIKTTYKGHEMSMKKRFIIG
jgi:hypothetical protein